MMSTVQDIESAIRQLSRGDLAELRAWLTAFDSDGWDQQIAADAESGRLDDFYQSLQAENVGQPDVPLDEIIHQAKFS